MSQSMLAIKTKLGSSDNNIRSYAAARGLSAPDGMLEFDAWLNPTCECWTIVNEGGGTGNYSYDRCSDGNTLNRNIGSGQTQTVCASEGTTPFQNTGTLTIYECNTPCSVNDDCAAC